MVQGALEKTKKITQRGSLVSPYHKRDHLKLKKLFARKLDFN